MTQTRCTICRLVALAALLAFPLREGFAQGAAAASAKPSDVFSRLMAFFGISRPAALDTFRSGDAGPTAENSMIWIVGRDGRGARPVSTGSGYRWPVFNPTGTFVAALLDGHIDILDLRGNVRSLTLPLDSAPPEVLISWTKLGVGLATKDGRIAVLDPDTSILRAGEIATPAMLNDVVRAARTCGNAYVEQVELADGEPGVSRFDIILKTQRRLPNGNISWRGKNLTNALSSKRNLQPALSTNCKQVVYVRE